ncbi:hypothetical protein [Escherichia coli]|uniref:hypothetical protein n=1 Tax=Escherichia coli TaxID=562 RepID=UPI0038905DE0
MMPVSCYLCIFLNVGLGEARFSGRLLNTNIFKSSGKYIPTPGTKKIGSLVLVAVAAAVGFLKQQKISRQQPELD